MLDVNVCLNSTLHLEVSEPGQTQLSHGRILEIFPVFIRDRSKFAQQPITHPDGDISL
ncbi:hypothetical protein LP420_04250 [Massilia sp. B-10]|nr:hypothetical protein LP420_04250 [Massilia sp. B-10]UUZ55069.1 hypothetical protein LP419_04010 [Massilia sp. H-1]